MERELRTKLPLAYREFMRRHGEAYTPDILDEIVDKNLEHPDVQNFDGPHETTKGTQAYWSGGMPDDFIGVASDCMGNMFGFARRTETLDDAPVLFFDHEFVDVAEVAPSFDALLSWYLDNLAQASETG